jgi:beta-glucosidase
LTWPAGRSATVAINGKPLNLTRETNADLVLEMTYRVDAAPTGPVTLGFGGAKVDATALFAAGPQWRTVRIGLKCLRDRGADMTGVTSLWSLAAKAPFALSVADIHLASDPSGAVCPEAAR